MAENIKKAIIYPSDSLPGQFFKSLLVGGIASLADISLFGAGVSLLGVNHIAANTVSFVFGLVINYYLSREWVFPKRSHGIKKDFLLFALIGIAGLVFSNILLFILIDLRLLYILLPISAGAVMKPAAKAIVVAVVFIWNFFARKKFVFSN